MKYLAKLDIEKMQNLKVEGGFSIRLRLSFWVKHLSNENNFNNFFNIKDTTGLLKKMKTKDLNSYTISVDDDEWKNFKKLCRDNKMSANYALNQLVDEYTKRGNLFEVKIWV
jgi:hypothetical protein